MTGRRVCADYPRGAGHLVAQQGHARRFIAATRVADTESEV